MVFQKIQILKKQIKHLQKKKILVLINESFEKMILGKNTSLAYILSCVDLSCDVHIHNFSAVSKILSKNSNPKIPVIHLNKNKNLCDELVKKFKELNQKIIGEKIKTTNCEIAEILSAKKIKLADLKSDIFLSEIEFVIQRLEPMKEPFPPQGAENLDKILEKIKNKFPQKFIFNCPINLHDKEIPQEINHLLKTEISTPTTEFNFNDEAVSTLVLATRTMSKKYRDLFPQKISAKIVLKPKNSAQSLGVFAVEFSDDKEVSDLEIIKKTSVKNLQKNQIYKIKSDISDKDLTKIVKILCYVQSLKSKGLASNEDILIEKISDEEILKTAKNLYDAVLVQPFLEGIRFGDVRVNLAKDENNKFYLAGCVFRKNNRNKHGSNFTTGFTSGAADARPISNLTKSEQNDLSKKISEILKVLNETPLQKKYQNSTELGLDFILSGDRENIFLGEINHNCPALLPIAEVVKKLSDKESDYDGGLALTKLAILQIMMLQENGSGGGN